MEKHNDRTESQNELTPLTDAEMTATQAAGGLAYAAGWWYGQAQDANAVMTQWCDTAWNYYFG
jgi:hypothetical protein